MPYEKSGAPPPRLAVALWPLAVLAYAHTVFVALNQRSGVDFGVLYRGATHFLSGQPVYSDVGYVFPPSGALLTAPLGWFDQDTAHLLIVLLGAVCAPVAGGLALRLAGQRWTGPLGAGVLLVLALSETVTNTLQFGNINTLLAVFEVAALGLQLQRRDLASGSMLGIALAIKPVMGLLLLLPLLGRRWRAVVAAVVIPAVLNVIGYSVGPQRDFITVTLPTFLHARPTYNSSLWAMGQFLGVNGFLILGLRVACVVLACVVLWQLRHEPDERLWLGVTSGTLLLVTFLAASLSETYWSVLLLPFLVTAVRPNSPMHSWLAWVGTYLCLSLDAWVPLHHPSLGDDFAHLRVVLGWGLLLTLNALWAVQRSHAAAVPVEPSSRDRLPVPSDELHERVAFSPGVPT
jgi:arabinofuranan 3-O-arabinosyltransferase